MKFLFLVGSALKHFREERFSKFSEQQRFEQTLKTIDCIRDKSPNSYIVLFDCSPYPISEQHRDILNKKCDMVLEFYNEPVLKQIYSNIDRNPELITFGKSLLETRGLLNSLYFIRENNLFFDVQRIFKLTGRYLLNEHFNIDDYKSKFLENKYVLKVYETKDDSDNEDDIYQYLYGCKGMVVTGLWSFDRLLYNEIIEILETSFRYMEKMIVHSSGNDIEHSLYRFLDKEKIVKISNLGLTLIKGMDGETFNL